MNYEQKISRSGRILILVLLSVPLTLLSLGIYHGLMQTLYRSGMISQASFAALTYYQGLTLHGVINAIVLTTFFAVAYGHAVMSYYLKQPINKGWGWTSAVVMLIGTVLAAYAMLTGQASVLYTFYAPMMAHPTFYLGVALLVVGSWISFFSFVISYRKWKKENKDVYTPLPVLATLVTFIVWFVCTLPAAYEILFMLLPWSMGMIESINIPLSRTLFWFFGHALVYFWLLPAYTMFYAVLPKLAGGKLYSENAGRLVFLLFLIFSIPVGVHHQFSEPSITKGVKIFQTVLTFGVAVPSFLTAFTIAASLEYGSWVRSGKSGGLYWLRNQPFFDKDNYLFAYLICGMILFIPGGLTGLINASYQMNNVVHNTAWLPGHFHMTVAGPVFLAIIGMSLYLLERIEGKPLKWRRMATIVPYLWTIGMLTFSFGLMWGGLRGEPRRTNLGISYLDPDNPMFRPDWVITTSITVMGGVLLFLASIIFFLVLANLAFTKKTEESRLSFPEYEALHPGPYVKILDNLTPWLVTMVIVILLAYVPAISNAIKYTGELAPPYSPDNPVPIELNERTDE